MHIYIILFLFCVLNFLLLLFLKGRRSWFLLYRYILIYKDSFDININAGSAFYMFGNIFRFCELNIYCFIIRCVSRSISNHGYFYPSDPMHKINPKTVYLYLSLSRFFTVLLFVSLQCLVRITYDVVSCNI